MHTCSASLSALTQSGERLTHELSTLRAQCGSCHGDLTWALTFFSRRGWLKWRSIHGHILRW